MADGFPNVIDQLIEKRLEDIFISEKYSDIIEGIYEDLENELSSSIKNIEEDTKEDLMDAIKSIVFDHVLHQSKLTYRLAFQDSFTLFVDTFLIPKK